MCLFGVGRTSPKWSRKLKLQKKIMKTSSFLLHIIAKYTSQCYRQAINMMYSSFHHDKIQYFNFFKFFE